ncbi:MAG: hypothetical protein MHM6MM_004114 [Cercozoa sp. M6MM]
MSSHQEHNFVLRLPPEYATRMRQALRAENFDPVRSLVQVKRDTSRPGDRHYIVTLDLPLLDEADGLGSERVVLHGVLADLPCVTEIHKTFDGETHYKSANLSRVLVCREVEKADEEVPDTIDYTRLGDKKSQQEPYQLNSGLTPPTSAIVERIFKPKRPHQCSCPDMTAQHPWCPKCQAIPIRRIRAAVNELKRIHDRLPEETHEIVEEEVPDLRAAPQSVPSLGVPPAQPQRPHRPITLPRRPPSTASAQRRPPTLKLRRPSSVRRK